MSSTIIVFSHLRWDFVYQRPQQLMARLAAKHRIIFFEEPILQKNSDSFIETSSPEPGVLVCKPHTPSSQTGFHDEQIPLLRQLLQQLIRDQKLTGVHPESPDFETVILQASVRKTSLRVSPSSTA